MMVNVCVTEVTEKIIVVTGSAESLRETEAEVDTFF